MCGGEVDSSAADAGSEVVLLRAALEHKYALQHAQMEIARLSVALKLSEAANDGLRDANNKLRMLLHTRTTGARNTETNANTLVQPSRKKRKVSADKYQYVGKCSHHMHERARAQEAAPDRTQTKLTIHYFSSIPTRPNSRCTRSRAVCLSACVLFVDLGIFFFLTQSSGHELEAQDKRATKSARGGGFGCVRSKNGQ